MVSTLSSTPPAAGWTIEACELDRVLPLRAKLTYAGSRDLPDCAAPRERDVPAFHFVATSEGRDVGAASLVRHFTKLLGKRPRWFLSFLAVEPDYRHLGIGSALVLARLAVVRDLGASYAWCEARVSAAPLYVMLGAVSEGEVYELGTLGPHVRMLYGPFV